MVSYHVCRLMEQFLLIECVQNKWDVNKYFIVLCCLMIEFSLIKLVSKA